MGRELEPVVISGVGVITSIGIGREIFWNALIEGRNGVRQIETFDTSAYRTHKGGEVRDFIPPRETFRMGRAAQFGVAAAREALADAEMDLESMAPDRVSLSLGTTMGESQLLEKINDHLMSLPSGDSFSQFVDSGVPDAITSNLARTFGIQGSVNLFSTACAAGNYAIGHAADLLQAGAADCVLAGGSDPISRIAYTGFSSMLAIAPDCCQPFDKNRKGMCPGEGCAMLVLERYSSAKARGARIYGELAGYGISNDAHHMTAPHPQGRGASRAMMEALRNANVAPDQVDYVSAHGTGTNANDRIETLALKTVFGEQAYRIPVSSIKSMLGHTMGAASAIEAVTCLLAIERGVIPPTINYHEPDPECDLDYVPNEAREVPVKIAISNAYAIGGHCSTIVLRQVH